jgi:hypothetical protein
MSVQDHASALVVTCNTVLRSSGAHTVPDPRITALAVRILDAAKAEIPKDKLLASIEIEHGSWPVILAAMHAVLQVLDTD